MAQNGGSPCRPRTCTTIFHGWLPESDDGVGPNLQGGRMQVHAFLQVVFQDGAWKQIWPEAGRITYKSKQDHASVEITRPHHDQKLRFRATKGTKVAISGNCIHLPDSLR